MLFYKKIYQAYDILFPLNKKQVDFIDALLGGVKNKSILDCGCGTGTLSIALGRQNARVSGFDLEEEMLNIAQQKCPQALNVNFRKDNLLTFQDNYKNNSFDFICCTGNTLSHLANLNEVELFFKGAFNLLKSEGLMMIQIVDYAGLEEENKSFLPTIEKENYKFIREYKYQKDNSINFISTLINLDNGEQSKQTVRLIPIYIDDIKSLIQNKFDNIKIYNTYNIQNYQEAKSWQKIFVCRKK